MELSKARAILKLLSIQNQQIRGLREIKKRLRLDEANVIVFRKLGILPILLKLVQKNTKKLRSLFTEKKEEKEEGDLDINPDNLDYESLKRLLQMKDGELRNEAQELIHHQNDSLTAELLLHCISLLSVLSSDYKVKLDCHDLGAVSTILPLLQCKEAEIVRRTLKVLSNLLQLPGRNVDSFIRMKGPSLVYHLLKETVDPELCKALINSIRCMSAYPNTTEEFLKLNALEEICTKGLSNSDYYVATAQILSHYASLCNKTAYLQIITATKELVTFLRVWQDNMENAEFHNYALRTVQHFVKAAVIANHNCNVRNKYIKCSNIDHRKTSHLAPIREKLVRVLFGSKAVLVLVIELNRNVGCLPESVLSALCTLCDGSLETGNVSVGVGKAGAAIAWMQMIDGGGIPTLMSILCNKNATSSGAEILNEDASMLKIQRRIFSTLQSLENNYSIQDLVLKHCLASHMLEAVSLHFDMAFSDYQKYRGNIPMTQSCLHKDFTAEKLNTDVKDDSNDNVTTKNEPIGEKNDDLTPLVYPLSPLSRPTSPLDTPPLVYTPFSPPSSPAYSPPSSPEFTGGHSPIHSPSSSPPYFMIQSPIKPAERATTPPMSSFSRYSNIHSGRFSPSCSPTRSLSPPPQEFNSSQNSPPPKFSVFKRERSLSSESHLQQLPKKLKLLQESMYGECDPVVAEIRKSRNLNKGGNSVSDSPLSVASPSSSSSNLEITNQDAPSTSNFLEFDPTFNCSNNESQNGNFDMSIDFDDDLTMSVKSQSLSSLSSGVKSSVNSIESSLDSADTIGSSCSSNDIHADNSSRKSKFKSSENISEASSGVKIREFNRIKFRVGKRRKQASEIEAGNCSKSDIELPLVPNCEKKTATILEVENSETKTISDINQDKVTPRDIMKSKGKSKKGKTDQSTKENPLQDLESIVRVMSQVCLIKEALTGVCREFLPRIVLYIRYAQVIHESAYKALLTITKTPCSIPPLLDTLFPAYVGVQLCEANIIDCELLDDLENEDRSQNLQDEGSESNDTKSTLQPKLKPSIDEVEMEGEESFDLLESLSIEDPTKKNEVADKDDKKCVQCLQLTHTGFAFLYNMSKFFGHVHQYGSIEANNRLRPNAPPHARETCLLNLPFVSRCPSLFHQLLASGGGLQDIINIISNEKESTSLKTMYATAGLHHLTKIIEVGPVVTLGKRCGFCLLDEKTEETKPSEKSIEPSILRRLSSVSEVDKVVTSVNCEKDHPRVCKWAEKENKDFKLIAEGDSHVVMVHRSVLCTGSTVWAAMLGGKGWVEDTSNEIKIGGNIGMDSVESIVHYLYGCRACEALRGLSLIGLINLLQACHMYGLEQLQDFATETLVQKCKTGEDVLMIYTKAVGRINEDVITAVLIKMISSLEVPTWKRAHHMCSIAVSPHGHDLLHNLFTILFDALEKSSHICNCDKNQGLYMASNSVYSKLI